MSAAPWKAPTQRDRIVRIVTSRPGIVASDVAIALGLNINATGNELVALAKRGQIVKHGARAGVRWSAPGVELAPVAVKRKPAKRQPIPGAQMLVKGGTVTPPPPRMPKPAAAPIITSATIVTVAPTPLPRFYVPADHRGAFSLAGVGRDVQTGQAWGA
jgi:hypothetical protein